MKTFADLLARARELHAEHPGSYVFVELQQHCSASGGVSYHLWLNVSANGTDGQGRHYKSMDAAWNALEAAFDHAAPIVIGDVQLPVEGAAT
jgi:hypothetical protein